MTKLTTGLAMLTALLAGGLIAVPAQAENRSHRRRSAGVLHVYGNADTKLFTEDGIKRGRSDDARYAVRPRADGDGRYLPGIPADKKAAADEGRATRTMAVRS